MKKDNNTVGTPTVGKPTRFNRIRSSLAITSQLIIASPLKLPPKIVMVAKYLSLALGVWEAVENTNEKGGGDEDDTP